MKKYLIVFLLPFLLFSCSDKDEPQIDFNVHVNIQDVYAIQASSLYVDYLVESQNVRINKSGVAVFQDNILVKSFYAVSGGNYQVHITDLTPGATYTIKAFAEYVDPNTKSASVEYSLGQILEMPHEEIVLSTNSVQHIAGGNSFRLTGFRTSYCEVVLNSNYGAIGTYTIEVSDSEDFANILLSKSFSSSSDHSEQQIILDQGLYYLRAITDINGKSFCSNYITHRVIKEMGSIISDGYVDLGLNVLWAAQYYTKIVDGRKKVTFPVSTLSDFKGYFDNNESFSGTQYDYITSELGAPFRTPTLEEYYILEHECRWDFQEDGCVVTGCTGNAIFIPYRLTEFTDHIGTSSVYTPAFVWSLYFSNNSTLSLGYTRHPKDGFLIRPVQNKQ